MVIVAAVDKSDRSAVVVEEAERLGRAFEEPVHIVHVMTRREFVNMGVSAAKASDSIDMEDVREHAQKIAANAAQGITAPHEAVGLMGEPGKRVVEYARKHNAEYIVVAGRKRSPVGKAVFGSVAQSIILNASCPILISTQEA